MLGSAELSNPLIEKAIHQMIIEMASRCQKIAPHYQQTIATIIGQEDIAIEKAKKILNIFQTEMARHIQQQQMELNRELTRFVKYEREKIDKLTE